MKARSTPAGETTGNAVSPSPHIGRAKRQALSETVRKALDTARERAGLSIDELARRADIPVPAATRYLRGDQTTSATHLLAMLDALAVAPSHIAGLLEVARVERVESVIAAPPPAPAAPAPAPTPAIDPSPRPPLSDLSDDQLRALLVSGSRTAGELAAALGCSASTASYRLRKVPGVVRERLDGKVRFRMAL